MRGNNIFKIIIFTKTKFNKFKIEDFLTLKQSEIINNKQDLSQAAKVRAISQGNE